MVKQITLTRPVSPVASPTVLGSADLAHASGGLDADASVLKTRHDTAKNAIGNIR